MVSFTTMQANPNIYVKVKPTHNVAVLKKPCQEKGMFGRVGIGYGILSITNIFGYMVNG